MMRPFVMLAWAAISVSLATCGAHADRNDETRAPRSVSRIKFTPELALITPESKSRVLHPESDYITKGDAIEIFVTPEEDVFVYLGYCHGGEFILYPAEGRVLRAEARHRFKIPEPYDVDDDDDRVLYVIASRTAVSRASADLTIAIAQSRQAIGRRAMDADCAGGPADSTGSRTPSVTPTDVRLPETPIRAVRYELLRRP